MKFTIKLLVAPGTPADTTPPMAGFKQLLKLEQDYPVQSVDQLPIQQIESGIEDICCRPVSLVEKQWGTPLNYPVSVKSASLYRHANRYDWTNGNSLWMCVEIQ